MELLENYFAELIQCVDASYLVIGIILVFRKRLRVYTLHNSKKQ